MRCDVKAHASVLLPSEGHHYHALASLSSRSSVLRATALFHKLHVLLLLLIPTNDAIAIGDVHRAHAVDAQRPTGHGRDDLRLHAQGEEHQTSQPSLMPSFIHLSYVESI